MWRQWRRDHAVPADLTVLLGLLEEGLFYIAVRLDTRGGFVRTSWLHEDGVFLERKMAESGSPIHGMVCMTDLFLDSEPIDVDRFQTLDTGWGLRESA